LAELVKNVPDPATYLDVGGAAGALEKLSDYSVVFVLNAQRHLERPDQVQLFCNLREAYKGNFRSIVLAMPQQALPAELQADVIVLDEPLPDKAELGKIIRRLHSEVGQEISDMTVDRAVEAVQGLPAYPAEQVTAMSMSNQGLDLDSLWERKRQQIEQTPGLSVSREGIKFKDLGGQDAFKEFMLSLLNGKVRYNAIIWLDEIEKMLAGIAGDTSGVSGDQLGTVLNYMTEQHANGALLVGVPGGGKSASAKAIGNEAGVPTVRLDFGAAKGGIVGQSEQQIRSALKVITSVSSGQSLWIATCNSLTILPPELRRRFKLGIWYFDLPDEKERAQIWKIHRARLGIDPKDQQPNDEGWTGAEIEQCAELAWQLTKPLEYAADFVVPVSQSAPEKVEQLREQANRRWLSASRKGVYLKDSKSVAHAATARRVQLDD
jgi:hypothetical protein